MPIKTIYPVKVEIDQSNLPATFSFPTWLGNKFGMTTSAIVGTSQRIPKFTSGTTIGDSQTPVQEWGSSGISIGPQGSGSYASKSVLSIYSTSGVTGTVSIFDAGFTGSSILQVISVSQSNGNPTQSVWVNGYLYLNTTLIIGAIVGGSPYTLQTIPGTYSKAAFFDYLVSDSSGTNFRAGTVIIAAGGGNASNTTYTETSTADFGTTLVTFGGSSNLGTITLTASVSGGTWSIRVGTRVLMMI